MLRTLGVGILCLVFFGRCAQQVAPTGGKKDTLAPILTQSIPLNKTLNFKGNRVDLLFDEYVVIDNITSKLIITPAIENPYTFKQNGMSVVLNFKKEFADSTTYTLNFGDAIKDFAEKNPAKNLKLVFSTGNSLDSGHVQGYVKNILSRKPLLDVLVGLYEIGDTLPITQQKPIYFSRTDSSGYFSIENTNIKEYKLMAVEDKNRNMLYNTKEESIGLVTNPVNTGTDTTRFDINMFLSDITPLKVQRTLPKVNNYSLVLNRNIEDLEVKFPNNDSLPYIIENGNQIKFYKTEIHSDTTLAQVTVIDSLGKKVELAPSKIAFQVARGKDRVKDPFSMSTNPESNKPISKVYSYRMTFNKPILKFDESQVILIADSLTHQPLSEMSLSWNKYKNVLTIPVSTIAKDTLKWELPKGSVISIEGDTLPQVVLKHPIMKDDDYGTLQGIIQDRDSSQHYVVELVTEQFKVLQSTYSSPYTFRNIPQGKYYLRLIIDENGNKRWDTGDAQQNRQPETIIYLPDLMLIKSNFELNDVNISAKRYK